MRRYVFVLPLLALFLMGAGCTRTPELELADAPPAEVEEVAESFTQCSRENPNGSVQCAEGNSWCGETCRAEPTCPQPTTRINCQTCTCECPDGTLGCVVGTTGNGAVPLEDTSQSVVTGTRPVPMKAEESLASYYINFSAKEFEMAKAEGRPILLYYYASWCPICRVEEPVIKTLVESMAVPVAGFRVDYDTNEIMKKMFNVPYQHTTVILNTNGAEVSRFAGPTSDTTMRAAIRDAYYK